MAHDEDELIKQIQVYNVEFNKFCEERMRLGEEEYGKFKFLSNDVLQMACEELADLSNYARMAFIKVKLLMLAMEERVRPEEGAFIPVTPAVD